MVMKQAWIDTTSTDASGRRLSRQILPHVAAPEKNGGGKLFRGELREV
jgi:hypothetical protein